MTNGTYTDDVKDTLGHTIGSTAEDAGCFEWVEVNALKWLFRDMQTWTREQANSSAWAAWRYVGF